MSKNANNNQNNHLTEEQPSDETQSEYRKISEEELKQILEDHQKWLESEGKEGKQAILYKCNIQGGFFDKVNLKSAVFVEANLQNAAFNESNLQEAQFFKANLQSVNFDNANLENSILIAVNMRKAFLREANLQEAKLQTSNLQEADLSRANLQKANLYRTNMKNTILDSTQGLASAKLQNADFNGSIGLFGNEFAQADVTGAKIPDDIKEFKALETVKETSQNARKIFFAMLLGCVYSWLTIATTTDVRLLTNTASSPLPIIQTEIPIAGFYWAAPLVLICLYFYFYLYLDNLWGALASLPAIFPDGKRLDERAYPWLLNTLVRKHFKRLKNRPLIARMKEWITIFLAWMVVPITMMAFWLRYIPRHDWVRTIFHIGLIVLSVAFAIYFYRLCASTLQGKEKTIFKLTKFLRDRRTYYSGGVIVVAVLFALLSYGAIEGVRFEKQDSNIIRYFVPLTFDILGYDVFADTREKDVSEKPTNYWEIDKEDRLESVKRANLKGRNLNYADMFNSFLVKADLRAALLKGVYLRKANLQQANLYKANLKKSKLLRTVLMKAYLVGVNLQQADLEKANLIQANLKDADLTGAKNLTIEQLSEVKTLYQAKLDPELMEQVKKCCPHLLEKPKEETAQKEETD